MDNSTGTPQTEENENPIKRGISELGDEDQPAKKCMHINEHAYSSVNRKESLGDLSIFPNEIITIIFNHAIPDHYEERQILWYTPEDKDEESEESDSEAEEPDECEKDVKDFKYEPIDNTYINALLTSKAFFEFATCARIRKNVCHPNGVRFLSNLIVAQMLTYSDHFEIVQIRNGREVTESFKYDPKHEAFFDRVTFNIWGFEKTVIEMNDEGYPGLFSYRDEDGKMFYGIHRMELLSMLEYISSLDRKLVVHCNWEHIDESLKNVSKIGTINESLIFDELVSHIESLKYEDRIVLLKSCHWLYEPIIDSVFGDIYCEWDE